MPKLRISLRYITQLRVSYAKLEGGEREAFFLEYPRKGGPQMYFWKHPAAFQIPRTGYHGVGEAPPLCTLKRVPPGGFFRYTLCAVSEY